FASFEETVALLLFECCNLGGRILPVPTPTVDGAVKDRTQKFDRPVGRIPAASPPDLRVKADNITFADLRDALQTPHVQVVLEKILVLRPTLGFASRIFRQPILE